MSNHSPEHIPPKGKVLRGVIRHLFLEIGGQSEKYSEVKLLLTSYDARICQQKSR